MASDCLARRYDGGYHVLLQCWYPYYCKERAAHLARHPHSLLLVCVLPLSVGMGTGAGAQSASCSISTTMVCSNRMLPTRILVAFGGLAIDMFLVSVRTADRRSAR